MDAKSIVKTGQSKVTRAEIEDLATAVEGAYEDTRQQIKVRGYERGIVQSLFGQLLHHNVIQRIIELAPTCPNLSIDLVPNRRRTAHHVIVKTQDLRITISAVSEASDHPRYARFREDYAQQLEFRINGNNRLEVVPVSSRQKYLQLLHIPAANGRHSFGEIVVAFPNHRGEYVTGHMRWGHFLEQMFGQSVSSDVEVIEDPFGSLNVVNATDKKEDDYASR